MEIILILSAVILVGAGLIAMPSTAANKPADKTPQFPPIPDKLPPVAVQTALKNAGIKDTRVWYRFDNQIALYANKYGVNGDWIKAMMIVESRLGEVDRVKNGEVSYDGLSYGVMQVTMNTGQDLYGRLFPGGILTPSLLNNSDMSINLGAFYLKDLSKIFPGDERKIILSYNQGPGNTKKGKDSGYYDLVKKWLDIIQANKGK